MRSIFAVLILVATTAASCIPKGGHIPESLPPVQPTGARNPFAGAKLFVDQGSQAMAQAKQTGGSQGKLLRMIANQPQADWLGEWTPNIEQEVKGRIQASSSSGAIRVMVAYNIPNRDCGQYSSGGSDDAEDYRRWITFFARGIGQGRAAIILEPDALGQLKDCLSPADQKARLDMLTFAVRAFRQNPNTAVYLDAGNANWAKPREMAERLEGAGIREAQGFALNVSNYVATDKTIAYGKQISEALGGNVGFVVDTSRNGQGEAPGKEWCNPAGRGLGHAPTTETGDPLVHALLWVKRPGESDGDCNGGPPAGQWFMQQALELARNAKL